MRKLKAFDIVVAEEGLKHIFGRMIRDFAMSAVAAEEENEGEEK